MIPLQNTDIDRQISERTQRVRLALDSSNHLAIRCINVSQTQKGVKLSGILPSYHLKQLAQSLAQVTDGVITVENDLRVVAMSFQPQPPSSTEHQPTTGSEDSTLAVLISIALLSDDELLNAMDTFDLIDVIRMGMPPLQNADPSTQIQFMSNSDLRDLAFVARNSCQLRTGLTNHLPLKSIHD